MASVLPLHGDEIGLDHLAHQVLEARLVSPAELLARLRGIAVQEVDFGRSIVLGVDLDEHLARLSVAAFSSRPLPCHVIRLPVSANASSTNSRTECVSPVAS